MMSLLVVKKLPSTLLNVAIIGCFASAISLTTAAGRADAGTITFSNTSAPTCSSSLNSSSSCFVEDGLEVEAFWGVNIGNSLGQFTSGHSHGFSGEEHQHFNGADQLQGFLIRAVNGSAFNLKSLDYQLASAFSIAGFSSADPKVLIGTSFNPTQSVASQFTAFSIGSSSSPQTLAISGFDNITQAFISSSASVNFDNVVTGSATAVPTPALLPGLIGLGVAALRKRKAEAAKQAVEV
jgi:hypothetical protein